MIMTRNLLLFFTAVFLASSVQAEMVKCNGIWTNRPCQGYSETKLQADEVVPPANKAEATALSKKRSLFHELTMKSIEARREYGVDLSLEDVESFCLRQKTSVDECREKTEKRADKIDGKLTQVALVRQKEENSKLKEENARLRQQPNTAIVITEDHYFRPYKVKHYLNDYHGYAHGNKYGHKRGKGHYQHGNGHGYGHGNHQSTHAGAGLSVGLSGSSGNTKYRVGGNINSSSHQHSSQRVRSTSTGSRSNGSVSRTVVSRGTRR